MERAMESEWTEKNDGTIMREKGVSCVAEMFKSQSSPKAVDNAMCPYL